MTSRFLHGDCRTLLPALPDDSINLVVTSPPYADSRKSTCGGVHPDQRLHGENATPAGGRNVLL